MHQKKHDEHGPEGSAYPLRLGDGLGVQFMALDARGHHLLARLATIMGLSSSHAHPLPTILLTASTPSAPAFQKKIPSSNAGNLHLPAQGWNAISFPFLTLWQHPDSAHRICQVLPDEDEMIDLMTMMIAMFPLLDSAIQLGGLPFHAGLIEKNGKGILLAGRGGTGKSTCCRRLPPPWQAHGDDEALIVPAGEQYAAHPFPTWSEFTVKPHTKTHWRVQTQIPLAALVFLEQAGHDELLPLGQGAACARINEAAMQIFARHLTHLPDRTRQFHQQLFDNASALAKKVPAYRLRVSREGRFWETLAGLVE